MPVMSGIQATLCRSSPWSAFASAVVLPWSLHGFEPHGEVLEIGAGSGAMAAALLARYRDVTMTVTDFDDAMVTAASSRLAGCNDRATIRQADATALPFTDASFDVVLSWVMLHHTVEWEKALEEAVRVVRPGGHVVGYDLLATAPLRLLHGNDDRVRLMRLAELRDVVRRLPLEQAVLTPSMTGFAIRFLFRKRS